MTTQISGTTGISRNALPFLVGQVCFFGMPTAPEGFLKCDGSAVSRTTYASLFTAIGTLYGTGDGSTTFNLPDLRGEFIRGWDNGRGIDSERVFGSYQADAFMAHKHIEGFAGVNKSATYGVTTVTTEGNINSQSGNSTNNHPYTSTEGGNETRPRNVALLACIFSGV